MERRLAPYIEILDKRDALCLLRFRTSNHKLPIETGRYKNVEYKDRHCTTCKTLGDEFHFLFICPLLHESRQKFIPSKFTNRPNMIKYKELLCNSSIKILKNLCKFIRLINKTIT